MRRWIGVSVLSIVLTTSMVAAQTTTTKRGEVHARATTLAEGEQTLFNPQTGLAGGNTRFDAKFEKLSLTQADQPRLLNDIQNLSNIPPGSKVEFEGKIDGRPFKADVHHHKKGELDVKMSGVQFASRQEAQAFIDSLEQRGAEKIKVKGTIDGQKFHASVKEHKGSLEEKFAVKEPRAKDVEREKPNKPEKPEKPAKPERPGK